MKSVKCFLFCLVSLLAFDSSVVQGGNWSLFPRGPMLEHDGKLFFTGGFYCEGQFNCAEIVTWDGSNLARFGTQGFGNIKAIAVHNDTVFIGTSFSGSGTPLFRVDSAMTSEEGHLTGIGVVSARGDVNALISYGGKLILGGAFLYSDQPFFSTNNICSWDGTDVDSLGAGLNSSITGLEIYGPDLIASGFFTTAGGQPANRVAKWNGSSWSALGTGIDGPVYGMAVYDGELYVCGIFNNAGGSPARNIARWNGSSWSAVGTGAASIAWKMTTCNNQLFLGGTFTEAGGIGAKFIAGWNGTNWFTLGTGVDSLVDRLGCYQGDLIVSAHHPINGGFEVEPYMDVWDGADWSEPFDFTINEGCCIGDRGNANGHPSDDVNISDVTFLTSYLFGIPSGPEPDCPEEANANGHPLEDVNISDVAFLTAYLFGIPSGPAPGPCP